MVSSAKKNDTRFIAVTLNSSSERTRITDNRRVLDYGFRYFVTKIILAADETLQTETVWGGEKEVVGLAPSTDIFLTLTPKTFKQVDTFISLDKHLQAPLEKGQIVGRVILELEGKKVAESQLITTEEVIAKGFLGRVWSNIKLLVYKFLMEEEA